MSQPPRPHDGIGRIAPYVGGAAPARGAEGVVKLSSNENPWGPSEAARQALVRAAHDLHRYPDGSHAALRAAIGEVHGLDPDRILCGAGSGELLALVAQAFAGRGDEIVHTAHGFAMYPIYAGAVGAVAVAVPERERTVDVDAILSAVRRKTRIVYVANPANPTGTMIGGNELGRLAAALPSRVLLVVDGAYAEYVEGYDGGASLVGAHENVVMTRTFSKVHGLGGLRVGWMYGPGHVIDAVGRIRGPFNLSELQQQAAEAAIRDTAWVERTRSENARLRAWLAEALAELGIPSDTSTANFVLARFASEAEARACLAFLAADGILVRHVAGYGLPHCLRITVGDEASCRRVVHAVGRFLDEKTAA